MQDYKIKIKASSELNAEQIQDAIAASISDSIEIKSIEVIEE